MVRSKSALLVKNLCMLLSALSCRFYSGSLQDWSWLAGTGLEEIPSSRPADVSAVVNIPYILVFPSLLIQKKDNYALKQAHLSI